MVTKSELKAHYAKLARLGCVLCAHLGHDTYDQPVEIHHLRRYGIPRNQAPAIPLCAGHHRHFKDSVHQLGAKGFSKHWNFEVEDLLVEVEARLNAGS
jgi:hypothetical protein